MSVKKRMGELVEVVVFRKSFLAGAFIAAVEDGGLSAGYSVVVERRGSIYHISVYKSLAGEL